MKQRKIQILSSDEMKKEIIRNQKSLSRSDENCQGNERCLDGTSAVCQGPYCNAHYEEYCNPKTEERMKVLEGVLCFMADGKVTGGQICNNSIITASGWEICKDGGSGSGSGSGSGVYAKDPVEACSGHQFQEPCEWMGPLDIDPHRGKCVHSSTTDNRLICSDKA